MARSGARAKMLNISEVAGMVGQQSVRGERLNRGYTQRTLPHFQKGDIGANARGFVKSSYKDGLNLLEYSLFLVILIDVLSAFSKVVTSFNFLFPTRNSATLMGSISSILLILMIVLSPVFFLSVRSFSSLYSSIPDMDILNFV